jgi:hypothetical protein
MLSEHFSIKELCRSEMADRLGIANTPDEAAIACLKALCENVLEPIRAKFGPFRPNSGFRCLDVNRAIGSKDNSQHRLGQAVDIECPPVSNDDLFDWVRMNLSFDQIIREFAKEGDPFSGWVHVSYVSRDENRRKVTTIG